MIPVAEIHEILGEKLTKRAFDIKRYQMSSQWYEISLRKKIFHSVYDYKSIFIDIHLKNFYLSDKGTVPIADAVNGRLRELYSNEEIILITLKYG